MKITLRKCTPEDRDTLRELSRCTYRAAFEDGNTQADMDAYLDSAFDAEKLLRELEDSGTDFFFLCVDDGLAGYLKLNESGSQTDIHDPQSLEIERIYVSKEYQGQGLGNVLMEKAVETARVRSKAYIWLGVWEKNTGALAFYGKHGFTKVGEHPFLMGGDLQTDYILRRDLPAAEQPQPREGRKGR